MMQADKRLAYIEKQNNVNDALSLSGSEFKIIAKEENLVQMHNQWLMSLAHLSVADFKQKYDYLSSLVGKNLMNVSQESLNIYNFLVDWSQQKSVFDLQRVCSVEVYGEIENLDWKKFFPDSNTDLFDYEFYSFAEDGAGGHYLLWNYDGLNKEPPVVYFSSEGGMEFLASSFAEYVNCLPHVDYDNVQEFLTSEEYEDCLYDCAEDYEELHGVELSEDKISVLIKEDIAKFLTSTKKKFPYDANTDKEQIEREKFDYFIRIMREFI